MGQNNLACNSENCVTWGKVHHLPRTTPITPNSEDQIAVFLRLMHTSFSLESSINFAISSSLLLFSRIRLVNWKGQDKTQSLWLQIDEDGPRMSGIYNKYTSLNVNKWNCLFAFQELSFIVIPVFVVTPFPCRPVFYEVPDQFGFPSPGFSVVLVPDGHASPERIKWNSRIIKCLMRYRGKRRDPEIYALRVCMI